MASLKDVPKESRDHIQYTRNRTMYILKQARVMEGEQRAAAVAIKRKLGAARPQPRTRRGCSCSCRYGS